MENVSKHPVIGRFSNEQIRFSRNSGCKSSDFDVIEYHKGDRAVGVACVVVAILLPLCSYIFGWHIGG